MLPMFGLSLLRLRQAALLPAALALCACEGYRVPALEKLQAGAASSPAEPGDRKADQPKVEEKPDAAATAGLSKLDQEYEARKREALEAEEKRAALATALAPSVDLEFLLSMNYEEAKSISPQSMELPNGAKVAAETLEVVKKDKDDKPKRVRAKGKVYLETGGEDSAKILCQEAYITEDEAILRGKPIMQRGGSIVEGLHEGTVFYMLGARLRVIGLHRLTNPNSMLASLPDLGPWTGGPNPLLPPLTENTVPGNIRDEMIKAAEAEAVLQQNKAEAMKQGDAPAAPWVKDDTHLTGHKKDAPGAPGAKPAAKAEPKNKGAEVKAGTEIPPAAEPAQAKPKRGFFGLGKKDKAAVDAATPEAPKKEPAGAKKS